MIDDTHWPLLQIVPDALLLTDKDGAVVFANAQAEKLLGYGRDELTSLRLEMLLPQRYRQRHAEHGRAYFAEPVVRSMGSQLQLVALTKDGRELPVDISLSPIETSSGLLVAASIRDVSERKKAEWQLHEALGEVERLKDRLRAENVCLREEIKSLAEYIEIVGKSDVLRRMLQKIDQVACTDETVLITGETGTGKQLVARAIHNRSLRRDRPFVTVNCVALPASLIESELFGHEKGAFTGALSRHIGRFEIADGGTIFLDEIGELPCDLQANLLRVVQDGTIERIGSSKTITTDVRVLAATNRDLDRAMQEGKFRHDLY
jgi:formate hydrogenlyase transcriptional activator